MAEVFEDKLMNLQERIVSTCLEALEGIDASVDTTYIYGYWTKSTVFFNVFFTVGNSVIGYGKLGVADDLVLQVFNHGKDDIREIADLYVKNDRKPPHQYRFVYGNATHSFDADYSFDDLEKSKKGPYEVFTAWKDKIAKNNQNPYANEMML